MSAPQADNLQALTDHEMKEQTSILQRVLEVLEQRHGNQGDYSYADPHVLFSFHTVREYSAIHRRHG